MIKLLSYTFLQMAYVVTDIDQAVMLFAEDFGIERFLVLRDYEIETRAGLKARKHIALAYAGAVQIELMQPLSGDDQVWRAALTGKSGFEMIYHHEGHLLSAREDLDAVRAEASGRAVVVDGEAPGAARYIYVDHRTTLGHYVEYIWYEPQAFLQLEAAIPRF